MRRRAQRIALSFLVIACVLFTPPGSGANDNLHSCSFCHSGHSAAGARLIKEIDVEVLCMTCHGPTGISILKAEIHANESRSDYEPFRISCVQCHDPHKDQPNWLGTHSHPEDATIVEGINIKLVGRMGPVGLAVYETVEWDTSLGGYDTRMRNVVFEQRGRDATGIEIHSFADADRDGNGIKDGACETCHTQTKFHCNGEYTNTGRCGESHNTGRTCTNCHDHTTNFLRR